MDMPEPDRGIIARKAEIVRKLRAALPDGVIDDETEVRAYECDAFTAYRCPPLAVTLPTSTEEVAAVLRICHAEGVPVVPRGSGTSLAGGALPTADCVLLGVSRLNQVLEIDTENRFIRVQTGRTNLSVSAAVEDEDFFYAPDPSSQLACAIAGNIAMNSGGAHCLKYGVTTNNLLGVTHRAHGRHRRRDRRRPPRRPRPRPPRRDLRLRGPARRRHRGDAAHPAQARGRPPGADGLLVQRGRRRLRLRHHPRRRPPRRHRVHGPARASAPARPSPTPATPTSRRCSSSRSRAPRPRSPSSSTRSSPSPSATPPTSSARAARAEESRADLEGPQGRLRRDGPDRRLHLPRRHHPGLRAALRPPPHRRAHRRLRPRRRQRLPRRRRQHAPADPLRRLRARASSPRPRPSATTSCGSASRSAAA